MRLSPVFFPRLTFGLLSVLGFIYLIICLRQLPRSYPAGVEGLTDAAPRVAIVYAFALSYPFLLPWLGYGFTSILVIGAMTIFLGNRIWWQAIPFAVLVPVAIRFIFERLLAISLPRAAFEPLDDAEEAVMRLLLGIFFPG